MNDRSQHGEEPVSDERLNAFLDGELDFDDSSHLLERLRYDTHLRSRLEVLREVKQSVCRDYRRPREAPASFEKVPGTPRLAYWRYAVAAGLLLATGFVAGQYQSGSNPPLQIAGVDAEQGNLLLHVADADPGAFDTMLDRIEVLFDQRSGSNLQIEVVANAAGLEWLRRDTSPFALRIAELMDRYPELRFVACRNAVNRFEERGTAVHLIERTVDDTTAIKRIVERLGEGWTYVAI